MITLQRILAGLLLVSASVALSGQTEPHMRKYKPEAPPAHIEVVVTKAVNGKPVANAAVIFHPMKGNKDEGNMEIKTNRDGVAVLDLIPVGDTIRLQVIADGFQTFGQDFQIDSASKQLEVKLEKPVKQSSIYADPKTGALAPPEK